MLGDFICWLMSPLDTVLWRYLTVARYDGIRIVECSLRKDLKQDFIRQTTAALELIARQDPRRYRRIRKEFGFIVHRELAGAIGRYHRWPSACLLDFGKFNDRWKGQEKLSWLLASTLVHEATHAVLFHAGVRPTPATRPRIEHVCHLEETRFAAHVNAQFYTACKKVLLDSPGWQEWYADQWRRPWWGRVKDLWLRRRESRRMSNKHLQPTP